MGRKAILPSVISYLNLTDDKEKIHFRLKHFRTNYQLMSDLMDAIAWNQLFIDEPEILDDLVVWFKLLMKEAHLISAIDWLYCNDIDKLPPALHRMRTSPNMRIVRSDKWK